MLRLIKTEFRRFFHRRIFTYAFIGVVAILGITLFSLYNASKPPSAAQIAQAQQWVDEERAWAEEYFAPGGQCEQEAELTGENPASMCGHWEPPALENYLSQTVYSEYGPQTQVALAGVLLFLALAIGISFITAEITSGSLSNWLTFAPQRLQVYLSKAVVLAIMASVIAAVFQVVSLLGFRVIADMNDALGTDPSRVSDQMINAGWRIVAVTVMAMLVGYVVGLIARHAAVGIGGLVLVAIVDPIVVALVKGGWRFAVTPRVQAWITGEYSVWDDSLCTAAWARGEGCEPMQVVLTQADGGWYLLGLTVVALVIGALVMKRRDAA